MARALLLAGLLALGACSVETEGAACAGLGDDATCPSGQRCGLDGKCAKDAVTRCPEVGSVIGVDPSKGGGSGDIVASGWPDIPVCRYRTLAEGMSAAAAKAPVSATVKVFADGSAPVVSQLASTFVIPANVTLTTELDPPDPTRFILRKMGGSTAVNLEGGAVLRGFTLQASTSATGKVLEVVCGSPPSTDPARLENVTVDGDLKAAAGVTVEGGCSLLATGLEVEKVAGSGLVVDTGAPTVGATVNGVSIHDNAGAGIRITSGKLVLKGQGSLNSVAINAGGGVQIEGTTIDASLEDLVVSGNGAAGVLVKFAAGAVVRIQRSVLAKNAATEYGPGGSLRNAGGLLLWGPPPTSFEFTGNTVCSNTGGDQVGVYSSNPWSISGGDPGCLDAQRINRISGTPTPASRLVFSTGGLVTAENVDWPSHPPDASWFSATGTVDYEPSCNLTGVLPSACN